MYNTTDSSVITATIFNLGQLFKLLSNFKLTNNIEIQTDKLNETKLMK